MASNDLLNDLEQRGLIHTSSTLDDLAERLNEGPIRLYCGFDPTADSLHVGNLVPLLLLRRFQDAGHLPIALAGGATGMIGDPTGRSDERVLLEGDTLASNLASIEVQLQQFLTFDETDKSAMLLDNKTWTAPMSFLEFLSDVGRHVTVNTMMARESIKNRLNSDQGISFTEFSYMLLQANDFDHLHQSFDCELQVGGSDQWGNICAGIDLIRRKRGAHAFGLTVPLVTRSDGSKFGKSQGGNIWLDPKKTSPYKLYQYWLGVDDRDVERFLLQLTLLPVEEAKAVAAEHGVDPSKRVGQRRLADEITKIIHGPDVLGPIEDASRVLFGEPLESVTETTFEMLSTEVPHSVVPSLGEQVDLIAMFVDSELAKSKGEVRKNSQGYYVNNVRLGDRTTLVPEDLLHGRFVLLRKGKSNHHLLEVSR